jgi:spore germination cell wall hydrolase CwlJ-like protein
VTRLSSSAGCQSARAARLRIQAAALGIVAVAAVTAVLIALLPLREPANAETVTMSIPSARAAALVQATSGAAANDMRAVGEQAKLINAALPFANDAQQIARPFALDGSDLDARRALLCLTQAVYYEAGFEPPAGRRAVAQVVLNRLRHPAFPKSVCGVVYQGAGSGVCQFTFVCDGALYRSPAGKAWAEAQSVARAALAGYVERPVGEATHYHADYVAPRWAPLLAKVAQVGQHIFYRWPGAWGRPAAFNGRYIGEPRDPLALRPAPSALTTVAMTDAISQVGAAPPVARAPNDVGGLLDTSKGWTLRIPGPEESGGTAAKLIASQQEKAGLTTEMKPAAARPVLASR